MSSTTTTSANTTKTSSFDLDKWQQGGLTSFSQSCFSEYWSNLPPTLKEGQEIDPYNYVDRMALGKYLIENTGGEKVWGSDCSQHWFWGYLAQMDWQRRSGRFQDPAIWKDSKEIAATAADCTPDNTISPHSWWGYMNLNFSVAVYCGAANAGLVPKIALINNASSIQEDKGFQQCIEHWKILWSTHHKEFAKSQSINDTNDNKALGTMYRHLWETHTDTIESGVANGKELEALLPEEDRNLGLGWCNMVELLASMNWTLLSLDCLYQFGAGYLPRKRLAGPEMVQWTKENRPKEYVTIQSMNQLKDMPKETMEKLCKFWSRVTFWEFQRLIMPITLDALSHGTGLQKLMAASRILALAAFPHSWLEAGVWFGTLSLVLAMVRK